MDKLDHFALTRAPTARRPLLGLTILLVEDSRFASEAVRLMCLRSGARIRRADSLETARKHLGIYRPTVLLVDVGLPDGSGLALIQSAAEAAPRLDVILGTSGDADLRADVMQAGADGFLEKPVDSLAVFQAAILAHIPKDQQPPGPRIVADDTVNPDPIAFQDDLNHIVRMLDAEDAVTLDYVTQFLGGVARSAHDDDLGQAVTNLAAIRDAGCNPDQGVAALSELVQSRIAAAGPI